jgi:hypothetical protein
MVYIVSCKICSQNRYLNIAKEVEKELLILEENKMFCIKLECTFEHH